MGYYMGNELKKVNEILKEYHQEHLLNFYDELTCEEKENLVEEILTTDFKKVNTYYNESLSTTYISSERISPIPYVSKANLSASEMNEYCQLGESILTKEQLAIITLAGGQGTRLGYKGPKGTYEIDVPPKKSLFEFACDSLKKVQEQFGVALSWYVMTSPSNDLATKAYFKKHNFFDYPEEKVKFFTQGTFPIIDTDGKVMLDSPYSIKTGSNGNGDVFKAFARSGLLRDLDQNNIKWIFIGGIDNILSKPADTLFLGLAISGNYSIASKSISKTDANSAEWIFANVDSKPSIVNPKSLALDANFDSYKQMNILSHLLTVDAFKKLVDVSLPYHRAFKKNPFINEEGMKEVPSAPNSYKFEKFIFDSFKFFDKLLLLEVSPNEEFAPIKAFTGNETPETALELYKKYYNLE